MQTTLLGLAIAFIIALVAALVLPAALTLAPSTAGADAPPGFATVKVLGNLTDGIGGGPTSFAYAPDGRIFIGRKTGVVDVFDAIRQAAITDMRTAGLNIMMSMKEEGKPISFVEDCAVPLEHLADYTSRLTDIFEKHGTRGTWYAHASVGCLHVRPVLNLRLEHVRLLACTHAHSDHYGQAAPILERAGCELWLHPDHGHMTQAATDPDAALARQRTREAFRAMAPVAALAPRADAAA